MLARRSVRFLRSSPIHRARSTCALTSTVTASGCSGSAETVRRLVEARLVRSAGRPARASGVLLPVGQDAADRLLWRLAGGDDVERPDVDLVVGLERRRAGLGERRAEHLHAGRELGAGREQHPCGLGGPRPDAEQPQELDARGVGDLVEPVEQGLAEVGEQLEQRDARVALVVVGPLRRVDGDPAEQLLAQLLEGPVVEDRD